MWELGKQLKVARSVLPSHSAPWEMQSGNSILCHWISISFICQIKLALYCNSSPFFLHKILCARLLQRRNLDLSVDSPPNHHSLSQVLIHKQASIHTRDFLFRTKWTSILEKEEAWAVSFTFSNYSVGKSSRSSKTLLSSKWKKMSFTAWDDLSFISSLCHKKIF